MKITEEKRAKTKALGALPIGSVFTDGDGYGYWIVTDIKSSGFTTCIELESGYKIVCDDDEQVLPVEAELVVARC